MNSKNESEKRVKNGFRKIKELDEKRIFFKYKNAKGLSYACNTVTNILQSSIEIDRE